MTIQLTSKKFLNLRNPRKESPDMSNAQTNAMQTTTRKFKLTEDGTQSLAQAIFDGNEKYQSCLILFSG